MTATNTPALRRYRQRVTPPHTPPQAPARAAPNQHALRLGERPLGVTTMLERSDRHDARERPIGKGKMLGIAANEIDVCPGELRAAPRDHEPSHCHVDTNGANAVFRNRTSQIAGPGADIEPRPGRSTAGRVEALDPLPRSRAGVHDVMHEARRLCDGRSWRHGPIRTHHGLERRAAQTLLEAPGLLAIVLETDPRVGLETEI